MCKIHTSKCGESYRAFRSDTSMSSSTIFTQRRERIGSVHEILHISPRILCSLIIFVIIYSIITQAGRWHFELERLCVDNGRRTTRLAGIGVPLSQPTCQISISMILIVDSIRPKKVVVSIGKFLNDELLQWLRHDEPDSQLKPSPHHPRPLCFPLQL